MVNTMALRLNLQNLKQQRTNLTNEINNIKQSISQLKRNNTWWEQTIVSKYNVQNGRYIDPYSNRYVTQSVIDQRKKFNDMITDLENKKNDKQREGARTSVSIYTAIKDIQSAKVANATEIKDLTNRGLTALKKAPRKILDGLKHLFGMGVSATRTSVANYQADKQNNVSFTDKVIDQFLNQGRTVAHSRKVAQQGSGLNQDTSQLDGIHFFNDKGNPTTSYDHYDQFSNSVDIDLSKEYRFGRFDPQKGLIMDTFKSATVVLTEDHKIDFSLPENQALLSHKEIVGEILSKYPEAFESLPLDVIEKDTKFYASKFSEGVRNNIKIGNFGVDKDGNALDETGYYNQMTEMSTNKRQQYRNLQQARQNFSQEMGEDYN